MSLFRREHRQFEPEPPVSPFPGTDRYGRGGAPGVDRAMQVSAVWACVRLLADSVSMMPLHGYTMRGNIRVPTDDPPLIVRPSADATTAEWVYMTMVSLLLRGNCYGRIVRRDSSGFPMQVELVDPDQVGYRSDPDSGAPIYTFGGKSVNDADVMHLRAFRAPGRRLGMSPIQYAATQINTDAAVSKFGLDYFEQGAHPSSILSTPAVLTQTQSQTIKDKFKAAVRDREPAVLTGDLKYEQIQVKPNESQFLETKKYGVAEIARIFGVPPEMIAAEAGNSMTYANVEQRALDFLTYSVQPWLTRLESAYAQMLPGRRHVRFDTSVLTRTDFLTTMQATAIGIASKQTTPDEGRALRDEAPLTAEQKDELDLVPLEITAQGKPRVVHLAPAPEGEPA